MFTLLDRDEILENMDENPIMYHLETHNNKKILIEHAFKSINKVCDNKDLIFLIYK